MEKSKLHRDGTVTLWDVYEQRWKRVKHVTDEVMATLPRKERERILRHFGKRMILSGF